jgi:hypothetical protein
VIGAWVEIDPDRQLRMLRLLCAIAGMVIAQATTMLHAPVMAETTNLC